MQDHSTPCLAEDELFALVRAGSLSEEPAVEAHLADCATCSALVAAIVERSSAPAWNVLAGTELGRYRLETQIGAGGMGAVYRARDTRLDRAIALKVLHDETSATRLAGEARAAAAIGHPAIVAIHDVGTANGVTYVAMELVDGESLRSVIERGPLPIARVRELGIELAEALAAAHARGVIHRDLKPENLVLGRDRRLRVLDFGLAKRVDADPLEATDPGAVQGTAGYMAPEQARGEPTDARADLFAVGAILFELATGKRAFPGATHAERLSAVLRDTPPTSALGLLASIVERCLAKDVEARFHSAADLAWALRGAGELATARPDRRTILVGAGAAVLAGASGFLLGRRRSPMRAPRSPAFHQLTYRTGRINTARFTRDGTRLVFGAAWDAEPVRGFVADLASGRTSKLDLEGDVLAVSRHDDIAAALGRRFTNHQSSTGTLAVAPLAGGGAARVLAAAVQDADFAGDDTLAVIRATQTGFVLEYPLGKPLVDTQGWITHARVSGDGKRIAYLEHPNVNDDAGDLVVLDVETRAKRTLSSGWSSIAGLAWHGDEVWFTGGRGEENNSLRAVSLDGMVRVLAQTTNRLRLHDVTRDRRAAVSVDTWRLRTLVGGTHIAERDCSLSEASFVVDISADASLLVVAELGSDETARGAYLVPVAGGAPLRLGPGFPLAISPSRQRVAANVDNELVAYTTQSGERTAIATPAHVTFARWIDETSLVALAQQRLWRLAIGAAPKPLADVAGNFALDATARRCAAIDAAGLHIIELASGARRTVGSAAYTVCGWLANDAILARTSTTPLEIVRIDPETGATSPHMRIEPPAVGLKAVDSLVVDPSGTRYAYSCGQELSQLYVMS